ncbi:MAG TPA: response regulator transcription factor [Bacillota bacterium]|nr:response regulator transcription factor [Bacillota bacterium]
MKEPKRIRLLVVDDHHAFRMGLVAMVNEYPDMKVVAEAGTGTEAIALCRTSHPDVVLMDLRLPGLSGVEATLAIRKECPNCHVIVVTTYDGDEDIYRALQSGAQGYLLKDMSKEELVDAIRAVQAGQHHIPPHVASRLAARMSRPELTLREIEVLKSVTKGKSNKEIAQALSITEDTVKGHLKSVYGKLGVNDRTQAAITALQHGILHLD